MTRKLATQHEKPWVHVDIDEMNEAIAVDIIGGWIFRHGIQELNAVGSRASKEPGIHDIVVAILEKALEGNHHRG
ncbi:conserved domain protein [delta proteobacterium NaphS2]|nr:conserved domain protein [delta proteobacterium NaphS2]